MTSIGVKTQWVGSQPWIREAVKDPLAKASRLQRDEWGGSHSVNALVQLLEQDLRRNQAYMAIRHFWMLKGLGVPIPVEMADDCEALMKRSLPGRVEKAVAGADRWLLMVRGPASDCARLERRSS